MMERDHDIVGVRYSHEFLFPPPCYTVTNMSCDQYARRVFSDPVAEFARRLLLPMLFFRIFPSTFLRGLVVYSEEVVSTIDLE